MAKTYGAHERAALLVLALAGRAIPNPELVHEHGITLTAAGRAKLNQDGLLSTDTGSRPYVHTITEKGAQWCWRELASVEAPPRSSPLVRAVFEVVRRVCRGELNLGELPADLESLIRAAYQELAAGTQDWVRLAKLRPKLDGADRAEVDEALLGMLKAGAAHLAPSSNRKGLTGEDHAAALRIGGEDNHLLAIEEA